MRQNHLRIDATRDMRSCFASDVENERPPGPKPPPWQWFRQHARRNSHLSLATGPILLIRRHHNRVRPLAAQRCSTPVCVTQQEP